MEDEWLLLLLKELDVGDEYMCMQSKHWDLSLRHKDTNHLSFMTSINF